MVSGQWPVASDEFLVPGSWFLVREPPAREAHLPLRKPANQKPGTNHWPLATSAYFLSSTSTKSASITSSPPDAPADAPAAPVSPPWPPAWPPPCCEACWYMISA